jgi:putative hydrolase of the HAD superfamily
MIRTILFDLDDTLYPPNAGIMAEIRDRILEYVIVRLELPPDEASTLRSKYLQEYGTTMRGLQVNHQIDAEDYLHFVHDFAPSDYLQANAALDAMLASIGQDKVIFTNACREHAERVLQALGIRRHFSRIIDVRDMEYESKPQPRAYRRVCELLGVRPEECLLVEDNIPNLRPAKALGMSTVLVRDGHLHQDGVADLTIERIEELGALLGHFTSLRLGPEDANQGLT